MAAGIKTGGRQKGTPNKLTFQIRQALANALAEEIEALPAVFAALEPEQKIDAICKLSRYVLPTMQTMDVNVAEKESFKAPEAVLAEIESSNRFTEMLTINL